MSCNFSPYTAARDVTRDASAEAKIACDRFAAAEQGVVDAEAQAAQILSDAEAAAAGVRQAAQAEFNEAEIDKQSKYAAWQSAERTENAEAAKLGIDPTPQPPVI